VDLETERLHLRPWRADDADDVAAAYDIYRRPEVARWLGATPQPWASEDVARERLRRWAQADAQRPVLGLGLWAVVPHDAGQPVGTVLLVPLPDADFAPTTDVEIGWHLHPDHWGRGYATEAAERLLSHGFDDVGLERINAVAHAGNDASFAVMTRLGMIRQGTTDRWYGTTFDWWALDAADRPAARP
jgi:RimJ/RimL family protein N-acetyltransferase